MSTQPELRTEGPSGHRYNLLNHLRIAFPIGVLMLTLVALAPASTAAQSDPPPCCARSHQPADQPIAPDSFGATGFFTATITLPTYPYDAYLTPVSHSSSTPQR